MKKDTIKHPLGDIAITEKGQGDVSVVFIHGNSACKEVFERQLQSTLSNHFHLLAFDLLGHGDSINANAPEHDYTLKNYAQLLITLLKQKNLKNIILVGWSLGGHIAIEALSQGLTAKGLVICGTPPIGDDMAEMTLAFKENNVMALTGKEIFNSSDIQAYTEAMMGCHDNIPDGIYQAVARTDGKARASMLADFGANIAYYNQRHIIETLNIPVAVFQGEEDIFIHYDFFNTIQWNRLWHGEITGFKHQGHAPFWTDSTTFNQHLQNFINDAII